MSLPTDARVVAVELFFLPVHTRVPLKFGPETATFVTCARAKLTVRGRDGREATGWGETPLSVTWVWPSKLGYEERHQALKNFCLELAEAWAGFARFGHALEVGWAFQEEVLPTLIAEFNGVGSGSRAVAAGSFAARTSPPGVAANEPMPRLAALVCCSVFDQALHDAYGRLAGRPIYETYNRDFMASDLAAFLEPATGSAVSFKGLWPEDFFVKPAPRRLKAWHLVGGLDPVETDELTGSEPSDGYPVLLRDWIRRDGLTCLKVKLRGNDPAWDYARLVKVGRLAIEEGVVWLTADFNCMVTDPAVVNEILDRLRDEHPQIYGMILYVEQPFPYELEEHPIDVHSVSARKPLFMDESAHDWRMVRLGRSLGWTGVALKTCKTQTGAILSACWAKAHGMTLMVQDLTNPMLAQIPHVELAAHVGTIMGVETNAMQFYPEASRSEMAVHPGIYQRRNGEVDLSTIAGSGFGHRMEEVVRMLPEAAGSFGS